MDKATKFCSCSSFHIWFCGLSPAGNSAVGGIAKLLNMFVTTMPYVQSVMNIQVA